MKLIALLMLVSSSAFAGSNISFSTSPFAVVVSGNEMSCYARNLADVAKEDVRGPYFALPLFFVNRHDASKDFVITYIRVTANLPGKSDYSCSYTGDYLRALSSEWYEGGAVIPAGQKSFSTDCPIYCGSVNANSKYTARGTVEVGGYERDSRGNKTSVRMSAPIHIENY
jgi:hypothetical protein